MKYVGVWKAYKRVRRAVRLQAPRPPASVPRFPCLEAIEPNDVVAVTMDPLGDRRRPRAAADDPLATR